MTELEFKQRKHGMDKSFREIMEKMKVINSGELESIPIEDFQRLMKELKKIKDDIEDTVIELEVDDFLENGAGRSRDVEYNN